MKSILLLLPTILFVACATQPKYKDITLEGAAANTAFHEWSMALPREFAYPVDYRFDMDLSIKGIPEMYGSEVKYHIGSNSSFASAWDYRSCTDLAMAFVGQEFKMQLGMESGPEKLRLFFGNIGMIEMAAGIELPSGVSLSTNRLHKVWDMVIHLVEVPMESMVGFKEFKDFTASLTGFGDFAHPMLNSRYLAMSPMLQADRWQIEGNVAHVHFGVNKALFLSMLTGSNPAGDGIDMDLAEAVADSLAFSASFNAKDGSMVNMTVVASIPKQDDFGGSEPIEASMAIDYSPLTELIAPIEFSDPEAVMDLDNYFDEYWPMVEFMMPMLEAQIRQQMAEQFGDDDGDFEF